MRYHLFHRSTAALFVSTSMAAGGLAIAQQAGTTGDQGKTTPPHTIAMVLPRENQNIEAGFTSYLQRQGVNARYISVHYSGLASDAPALRKQVRAIQPDLIYAWGTPTTLALAGRFDQGIGADNADSPIRDIPIVFTEVSDPVGAGLIPSMAHPQRNVTGVSHIAPLQVQLNAARAYRSFQKLGYIHNPAEPNSELILKQLRAMAQEQQFNVVSATLPLQPNGTPDDDQIAATITSIAQQGADFLYIGPITYLAYTHRDIVTNAALANRLPTFCATESIVRQSGCMFGLFSNGKNVGAYAGSMARQILLEHKSAASIPASTLQRFSLLVNMHTASELKLYPPMLLLNVAEVINVKRPEF